MDKKREISGDEIAAAVMTSWSFCKGEEFDDEYFPVAMTKSVLAMLMDDELYEETAKGAAESAKRAKPMRDLICALDALMGCDDD